MKDIMLIVHFIGIAMAVGTGFANMFIGIAASKLAKDEALTLLKHTSVLVRMGTTGLLLLVISGGYLIGAYMDNFKDLPLLHIKLALVLLIIILVGRVAHIIVKSRKQNDPSLLLKLRPIGMIALISSIIVIILAVQTFH